MEIQRFLRTFKRLGLTQKYNYLEEAFVKTFPIWVNELLCI